MVDSAGDERAAGCERPSTCISPAEIADAVAAGRARRLVLVCTLVLLAVSVAGVTGPVAAGDQVAIVSSEPAEVDADPGDEFTVDVVLYSEGGHGDDGIEAVTLAAQYHPDYLEITDVERGPWLGQGNETDVQAERTLAHDDGTALVEQWREPVAGGATGMGTVATLTVEVAEDAPAGETTIEFGESDVALESEWPVPVLGESTTVVIDGGEGELESFDHPDSVTDTDPEALSDENDTERESGTEPTGGVAALVPGSGPALGLLLAAVAGIALVALVTVRNWQ